MVCRERSLWSGGDDFPVRQRRVCAWFLRGSPARGRRLLRTPPAIDLAFASLGELSRYQMLMTGVDSTSPLLRFVALCPADLVSVHWSRSTGLDVDAVAAATL